MDIKQKIDELVAKSEKKNLDILRDGFDEVFRIYFLKSLEDGKDSVKGRVQEFVEGKMVDYFQGSNMDEVFLKNTGCDIDAYTGEILNQVLDDEFEKKLRSFVDDCFHDALAEKCSRLVESKINKYSVDMEEIVDLVLEHYLSDKEGVNDAKKD